MKKVTIVEDNAEINHLIKRILISENYQVEQYFNGLDVLDSLDEIYQSDIILLDIMLPGTDGFQIYEELKKNYPSSLNKVVFLTAMSDDKAIQFFQKNYCQYIIKPFDPFNLLNILKKMNIT
ncbi:MAG TPA: hypothetical protein DHW82_12870 [Spirochaetia bacterium]|nr:MAG: hypothetical protein A2Y41_03330 [Spirochaetes bacterium GWB1_36_13]HCL57882.1 hypothetical protein [Spirochaetia bacterium]